METVYRDYAPQGVKFYYIYKALAHPENDGYVQPFTLEERLMHVKEARRTLGSQIPWLADNMQNDLKHGLGDAPNSEFIVDPEGRVVRKRMWSDPSKLRRDLEELIGPVAEPTRVDDLDLKTAPPPKVAVKGVVPRIQRPHSKRPLVVEPVVEDDGQPFYAKLRAEADSKLLRSGTGQLYLGFHLDPLYHVHWNNLTKPIRVRVETPEGVEVSPSMLTGPKVDEPADVDPREFLVELTGAKSSEPVRLNVSYFACNDEQGWCKPVTQKYLVRLQQDRDGGWIQQKGKRADARGQRRNRPGARRGATTLGRLAKIDAETRTVTLSRRDGKTQKFRVAQDARLIRDRRPAKLSEFVVGDRCRVRYRAAQDDDPPTVNGMMARSMQ